MRQGPVDGSFVLSLQDQSSIPGYDEIFASISLVAFENTRAAEVTKNVFTSYFNEKNLLGSQSSALNVLSLSFMS